MSHCGLVCDIKRCQRNHGTWYKGYMQVFENAKIFRRLDYTPLQLHQTFIILAVCFTVPFYHFLFSRYLHLTERHFSSYILVPFPDSSYFYGHAGALNKENFDIENFLALEHFPQKKNQIDCLQSLCSRLRLMVEGWKIQKHSILVKNTK